MTCPKCHLELGVQPGLNLLLGHFVRKAEYCWQGGARLLPKALRRLRQGYRELEVSLGHLVSK